MSKDKFVKRNPSNLMGWERDAIIRKITSVVDLSSFFSGEDLERIELLTKGTENIIELFDEIRLDKIVEHKTSITFGDVMPIDEFLDSCQNGWITDDDGSCTFIDEEGYLIEDSGYIPYICDRNVAEGWKKTNPSVKEVIFYGK